jgi:hypothetical protein
MLANAKELNKVKIARLRLKKRKIKLSSSTHYFERMLVIRPS